MNDPASLQVGVAVLGTQLAVVIKDVSAMQVELEKHRQEHRQAERDRMNGRRWLAGLCVAMLSAVGGLYALILQLLAAHH